jgi:hypothetical protein
MEYLYEYLYEHDHGLDHDEFFFSLSPPVSLPPYISLPPPPIPPSHPLYILNNAISGTPYNVTMKVTKRKSLKEEVA